ncbi:MAG: hypothetical protein VXW65_12910 [Pseudomonadota bacterium]|nr:hypothetical protein [Pseudomonadota bacterium]
MSDSLGFLVGQKRLNRTMQAVKTDTQEIIGILRQMLEQREANPPGYQLQGIARAIAEAQARVTVDYVRDAMRSDAGTRTLPTVRTVDITHAISSTDTPIPSSRTTNNMTSTTLPTRPTVDSANPPTPPSNTPPVNSPDSRPSTSADTDSTTTPPSNRTDYVRDARGRFVPRNRAADADRAGGEDKPWFDQFKTAVSRGVSTGMADTRGVDPTVDAINELGGLLSPLRKAAGFTLKPISMLVKRNKRSEPLPADQERHNRDERRFWARLVDAVRAQSNGNMNWAGRLGALVIAGAMAALRRIPVIAAVLFGANKAKDWLDNTETGQKAKTVAVDAWTRLKAAAGDKEAQAAVAAADAKDDAARYSHRDRVGSWGSTDRIYEFGRSIGAGSLLRGWGNEQQGSDGGALGRLIGSGEGDYNSYNQGIAGDSLRKPKIDLSSMTVAELMRRQRLNAGDGNRIFAAGKYQVIPKTLEAAVTALGIDPNAKFTPELQELIFSEYLAGDKRKNLKAYRSGHSNDEVAAAYDLALEFASVGVPSGLKTESGRVSDGTMTYYDKRGGNRASISADQAMKALREDRSKQRALTQRSGAEQPKLPDTPTKLPESPKALAEYAESLPAPAANVTGAVARPPVMSSLPTTATSSVAAMPITASSNRLPPRVQPLPAMPPIREQVSSSKPQVVTIAQSANNISQNVGDRAIAHAVTGGLGMRGVWEG